MTEITWWRSLLSAIILLARSCDDHVCSINSIEMFNTFYGKNSHESLTRDLKCLITPLKERKKMTEI